MWALLGGKRSALARGVVTWSGMQHHDLGGAFARRDGAIGWAEQIA